jgi:hypothetical protein
VHDAGGKGQIARGVSNEHGSDQKEAIGSAPKVKSKMAIFFAAASSLVAVYSACTEQFPGNKIHVRGSPLNLKVISQ